MAAFTCANPNNTKAAPKKAYKGFSFSNDKLYGMCKFEYTIGGTRKAPSDSQQAGLYFGFNLETVFAYYPQSDAHRYAEISYSGLMPMITGGVGQAKEITVIRLLNGIYIVRDKPVYFLDGRVVSEPPFGKKLSSASTPTKRPSLQQLREKRIQHFS